jgi:hypothetical protein
VDPVSDPLLLRRFGTPGIEPGPQDLYPGTLTTRPQRQSRRYERCAMKNDKKGKKTAGGTGSRIVRGGNDDME